MNIYTVIVNDENDLKTLQEELITENKSILNCLLQAWYSRAHDYFDYFEKLIHPSLLELFYEIKKVYTLSESYEQHIASLASLREQKNLNDLPELRSSSEAFNHHFNSMILKARSLCHAN